MMRPAVLSMLLTGLSGSAIAQTPPPARPMAMAQPACAATAALPAAYASFAHPAPAAQGTGALLGRAATIDLGPRTPFAVPPGHTPAGGTFGGTVGFDVTDPGTYRVAIDTAIWVDAIKDGTSVRSIAHAMGPACTTVRKTVDFVLTPGHYTLQFSGSEQPSVTFQVARVP